MKWLTIIALMIYTLMTSWAQSCPDSIRGIVINQYDGQPLSYANVWIPATQKGSTTANDGTFTIKNVCQGTHELHVSHLNCENVVQIISIPSNGQLRIYLEHQDELLSEVHIEGISSSTQLISTQNTISADEITKASGASLAQLTSRVSGVSTLSNGSSIGKPIIHGLYGNRVQILNNGLSQAGQQWGNDHAPEIDPLINDQITIIKGASAVQYGARALGGVIQVNPNDVNRGERSGSAYYAYQTNGRGHSTHLKLEDGMYNIRWRLQGAWQRSGDKSTPQYYLTNTGTQHTSIAAQAHYNPHSKLSLATYYSYYRTRLGVLRGSHIGNLTDLREAIGRSVPFFTQPQFSYQINAPQQRVAHHLFKIKSQYFWTPKTYLTFTYGAQINDRREYDVRRSGRSERPALSLLMTKQSVDAFLSNELSQGLIKYGIQYHYTENTNDSNTGIFPLIPDYRSYTGSPYAIYQRSTGATKMELGARLEYRRLKAALIERNQNRIVRKKRNDINYALAAGLSHRWSKSHHSAANINIARRAPEVNELYSAGLHQGVAALEEGDESLSAEQSIKLLLTQDWQISPALTLSVSPYFHYIIDYIYLQPQATPRLTIRGAFPVFIYEQTDALLYGWDIDYQLSLGNSWQLSGQYSLVRGDDVSNDIPLINMPSDNIKSDLSYKIPASDWQMNSQLGLSISYSARQKRLRLEQDLLVPPPAYSLLGLYGSSSIRLGDITCDLSLRVDNLLNITYRNYLNRLRYFSDEEGRNTSVSIKLTF